MPKKLLSILLSCTVFLYGVGCSRYNEKVGLSVNLEPSIPIVDDVTANQNSSTNSDLPKPAVDDVSDQSSDAKPEASKAVVENKEEVKEDKDKEVSEESKPKDDDANSKSNKPEEEKKPDPAPIVNPLNNNGIPQAAGLAIGVAMAAGGIIAIAYAIYNRFFGGAEAQPANNDPQGEDNNPQADPKNDDNKKEKDPPPDADVNDGNEEEDDGMGEVPPQVSGQSGVLKVKVSPQQTQTKEKKEKKEKRQGQQEAQPAPDQPNPQPEVDTTDLQAQPEAEAAVGEVAAQPEAQVNPQRRPVIPRPAFYHLETLQNPLTPMQEAENDLLAWHEWADDFRNRIADRTTRADQRELNVKWLRDAEEDILEAEDRIFELRAQQEDPQFLPIATEVLILRYLPENPVAAAAAQAYITETIRIIREIDQINLFRNPITRQLPPDLYESLEELIRQKRRAYEDLANNPAVPQEWKDKSGSIIFRIIRRENELDIKHV